MITTMETMTGTTMEAMIMTTTMVMTTPGRVLTLNMDGNSIWPASAPKTWLSPRKQNGATPKPLPKLQPNQRVPAGATTPSVEPLSWVEFTSLQENLSLRVPLTSSSSSERERLQQIVKERSC